MAGRNLVPVAMLKLTFTFFRMEAEAPRFSGAAVSTFMTCWKIPAFFTLGVPSKLTVYPRKLKMHDQEVIMRAEGRGKGLRVLWAELNKAEGG